MKDWHSNSTRVTIKVTLKVFLCHNSDRIHLLLAFSNWSSKCKWTLMKLVMKVYVTNIWMILFLTKNITHLQNILKSVHVHEKENENTTCNRSVYLMFMCIVLKQLQEDQGLIWQAPRGLLLPTCSKLSVSSWEKPVHDYTPAFMAVPQGMGPQIIWLWEPMGFPFTSPTRLYSKQRSSS